MAQKYKSEHRSQQADSPLLNTYNRQHISFERGKGSTVWDTEGREYLDFVAGIAVNSLGYSHPRLVAAICNQAMNVIHTSNLYEIENQAAVAGRIVRHLSGDGWKVFFSNSGAEANEAAIKFAMKATGRRKIVSMNNSFHGRTALTLSVTGQPRYWKGFEQLLNGNVSFADYGDAESVRSKLDGDTACVILEPVQGEGGVVMPGDGFMGEVSRAARENGSLLIVDEVQTGAGRTGRFFAHSWDDGCSPDIVTMAKALAGGVPIGATIVSRDVSARISPGDHGSTFGGNPLSTAAANAVLDVIESAGFMEEVERKGKKLIDGLRAAFDGSAYVHEVRGKGLMVGIDMTADAAGSFKSFAFDRGYLVNVAHDHIVRLVPPLIVTDEEIESLLAMAGAFKTRYRPQPAEAAGDK